MRAGALACLLGVQAAIVSVATIAHADPQVTTRVSARKVEVGEPFSVQLSALVTPGEPIPNDPRLAPPAGATIQGGPAVGTSMVSINGSTRVGIDASWQLVSNAPGRVKIPAPSVLWQGKRVSGQAVEVEVVPASGRRRPQSPFLLPGGPGLFGQIFGGHDPFADDDDDDEPQPALDEKLELKTAPDPYVFLHARADKKEAVVGEQVTVSFYIYQRVNVEMAPARDASMTDFIRMSMISTPGFEPPFRTRAGGKTYMARLIDRVALFPVRTGDLHVGPMTIKFSGQHVGRMVDRSSEDLVIHVTEPPRAGRPPGYVLGDVGRFSLSATVEPRRLTQGGSIAVTVQVKGSGNFPQTLAVPARTGVEWLDPEKRESIGPQGAIITGYRSFGYVVRIQEQGQVELGKIDLPYWDPTSKRYEVASVELGKVDVAPSATPDPRASASASPSAAPGADPAAPKGEADPFATLPAPRATLGAFIAPSAPLFDGASLYVVIAAPPLAYGLLATAAAGARRLRSRRAAGASSPTRLANVALDEADQARERGDTKALSAAVERAIHHAIKAATDLESRGILLGDLTKELEDAGVSEDLASRTRSLLDEASALRFDPGASAASLEELAKRGRAVVRDLLAVSGRARG
ncbi:BatD family protein [Polyangium sp. y55x31]|uniref:BatD family protein n=1 Tax=Polyangium sp. y55x31 TaxID=3042688 RepID=UPI002482A978|nr:BatD family protein [Polyangium sp. y55x31]MDI1477405.1 BatD family protein [Polyangium sp. y55x31]